MLYYLKQTCEFLDFQEYFAVYKHGKPNAAFFLIHLWSQKHIWTADTHKHTWRNSRNCNWFIKNPVTVIQNGKEFHKYIN